MMCLQIMLILLISLYSAISSSGQQSIKNLTVMTFNIWVSGSQVENGTQKIANHIRQVNPDVVGLQEVTDIKFLKELLNLLGKEWQGVASTRSYADTAILTKHKINSESFREVSRGFGVEIDVVVLNRTIHVYDLHLDYRSYGPYAAFNKMVTKKSQIMAGELTSDGAGRFQNMRELLVSDHFQEAVQKSSTIPLIICGDFNAPSHLDWTDETKDIHGGWSFEWPATKMLQDEAKVKDSYREIHPNVLENPGITWSTVEKMSSAGWSWTIPEPQDRIDFIFYRSQLLKPVQSYTYQGHEPVYQKPNHWKNDYPSDHFAVVTTFHLS